MQKYRKNNLEEIEKDIEKLYIKRDKIKYELDEIDDRIRELNNTYNEISKYKPKHPQYHPSNRQQSSNVPRQPSLLSVTHIPMQSLNTHPKHPSIKKPPKLKRNPSIPSLKYFDGFNSTAPNSTGLTRHASNLKLRKAYIESVIKAFQPMEVPEFSDLVINICNKCEEFLRHNVEKIQSKILNPSVNLNTNLNTKVQQFYMDIKKLIDEYDCVVLAPAPFGTVPPHDRIVEITNEVFPILFDIYK